MNADAVFGTSEKVLRFGTNQRLNGIFTPAAGLSNHDVGMIIVSAGLVHRAGPFRIHVNLARALAARGVAVLRFDQSGVGESVRGDESPAQSRLADIKAAIDLMQRFGVKHFVIWGICSGADDILHVLPQEPRLDGAFLLDGPAWRDWRYHAHHLLPRLFSITKWVNWLRKRSSANGSVESYRDFPSRDDAEKTVAALVDRGVNLLFLYTGGAYEYFNHRAQFAYSYGIAARSSRVRLEYWPHCDHTAYAATDRAHLVDMTVQWILDKFCSPSR